jgi:hypothetical protein
MSIYTPANRFYVYMYLRTYDSNIAKAGTPYYIGKGQRSRATDVQGHSVRMPADKSKIIYVETDMLEEDALQLEVKLIAQYGRIDLGTGILRNMTDGGDGVTGYWTEERKKELSQNTRDDWNTPAGLEKKQRLAERNTRLKKGTKWSDESKDRLSQALKDKPKSEQHRKNISESHLKYWSENKNKRVKKICIKGTIYDSAIEASKVYNIDPVNIRRRCRLPQYDEWNYVE